MGEYDKVRQFYEPHANDLAHRFAEDVGKLTIQVDEQGRGIIGAGGPASGSGENARCGGSVGGYRFLLLPQCRRSKEEAG